MTYTFAISIKGPDDNEGIISDDASTYNRHGHQPGRNGVMPNGGLPEDQANYETA